MQLINSDIITKLYREAKDSDRLRAHHLLHTSHQDKVQRLLIGLIKGSYVEPHYHNKANQWEMFIVLEGVVQLSLHNESGEIIDSLTAGPREAIQTIEIQPCEVHSLRCLSDKALLLEIKEGPFDPNNAKTFIL